MLTKLAEMLLNNIHVDLQTKNKQANYILSNGSLSFCLFQTS